MSTDAVVVALITVVSLALVIARVLTLDAVGIGLLVALTATGIVDYTTALKGFANPAVLTLAGLYVIAEGLVRTGGLEGVARRVLSMGRGSALRVLTTLCLISAGCSAFLSDTAVVLILLPVCLRVASELNIPVSRLLLPVAYSSLLGGTLSLVGSSINLLTSAAAEELRAGAIGMFEMTPVALLACLVGIPATILLCWRFLPDRSSGSRELPRASPREYVTEVVLSERSPLLGQRALDAFGRENIRLLFIVHGEKVIGQRLDRYRLRAGDVIVLEGNVSQLVELESRLGLRLTGETRFDPRTMTFFELAISPHARVIGRPISSLHLYENDGAVVVAVLRQGHAIRERASRLPLRVGDLLLVCGSAQARERLRDSTDFFLLTGAHAEVVLRGKARTALLLAAAVVALFAGASFPAVQQVLPVPIIALLGAVAMVGSGCVTARRAYRTIDWPILIFLAGALALGKGLQATGLATLFAEGLVMTLQPFGPAALASGLMLLGTVLNQLISPYAVVVLLMPIALAAAESAGLQDVRPLILAIAFSGSNAFATPMGHQVNLMVMGPGGYRFADFLRVGLPLCALTWIVVSVGLALQSSLAN